MSHPNHTRFPLLAGPALALALLGLSACKGEDITRTFGLVRDAPDEFQVTTRAPLSMPPDFTLRAPRPGAERPQEESARRGAEATLAPQSALRSDGGAVTPGQSALVAAAGPAVSDEVRAKINSESVNDSTNRSITDRLMFWRTAEPAGTVVDPTREAQRLRQNSALGQDVQQGDTPIIQRKSSGGDLGGLLDRIF